MNSNFCNHPEARMLCLFKGISEANSTEYLSELVLETLALVIPTLTKGKQKKIRKILGT